MKIIPLVTSLMAYYPGMAVAADVYKCLSKDKKVIYSDTPCSGGSRVKPPASGVPNTKHFTSYQVNLAYDCMEALATVIKRDGDLARNAPAYETANLRNQFEKLCPAVGFQVPEGPATRGTNLEYVKILRKDLDDNNHTGPTYTRVYQGGQRNPPLFSGY